MEIRNAFFTSSREDAIKFDEAEGRTQQQFATEVDINEIVRRFGLTGTVPPAVRMPLEGDFLEVVDFQTAMNVVRRAEEEFMQLPGHVRERFAHNPQRLLEFVSDPSNYGEAQKLGLLSAEAVAARVAADQAAVEAAAAAVAAKSA